MTQDRDKPNRPDPTAGLVARTVDAAVAPYRPLLSEADSAALHVALEVLAATHPVLRRKLERRLAVQATAEPVSAASHVALAARQEPEPKEPNRDAPPGVSGFIAKEGLNARKPKVGRGS